MKLQFCLGPNHQISKSNDNFCMLLATPKTAAPSAFRLSQLPVFVILHNTAKLFLLF